MVKPYALRGDRKKSKSSELSREIAAEPQAPVYRFQRPSSTLPPTHRADSSEEVPYWRLTVKPTSSSHTEMMSPIGRRVPSLSVRIRKVSSTGSPL